MGGVGPVQVVEDHARPGAAARAGRAGRPRRARSWKRSASVGSRRSGVGPTAGPADRAPALRKRHHQVGPGFPASSLRACDQVAQRLGPRLVRDRQVLVAAPVEHHRARLVDRARRTSPPTWSCRSPARPTISTTRRPPLGLADFNAPRRARRAPSARPTNRPARATRAGEPAGRHRHHAADRGSHPTSTAATGSSRPFSSRRPDRLEPWPPAGPPSAAPDRRPGSPRRRRPRTAGPPRRPARRSSRRRPRRLARSTPRPGPTAARRPPVAALERLLHRHRGSRARGSDAANDDHQPVTEVLHLAAAVARRALRATARSALAQRLGAPPDRPGPSTGRGARRGR